ncbi:multiple epidermal growth factor-like domains protein 10 isoform X1 [Ostrea edulis]|uniref:multiple epidermal growth factor-like domains protein 10 isoform X1 n=1 Tax=Ostrea edulis TaxID=37623 RepID=UPI0024AE9689|nr:multiple epidermal growth factor-like domains protein 10 isoform X1 [Ostrea edulis]
MACKGIFSVIYFTSFVPISSFANSAIKGAICENKKTGKNECCYNHRNVSGTCEACVGSWGRGCEQDCEFGFFGQFCKEKCSCSQNQICNPVSGCVNVIDFTTESDQNEAGEALNLQTIITAVGGVLVLSLIGTILFVRLKLKQDTNTGKMTSSVPPGNECTFQLEQKDCIYNDVRESRMIDNSDLSPCKKHTLPRNSVGRNIHMQHWRSLPRRQPKEWQNQLTRSRTLVPGQYGRYNRYSDDYNHLQFNKMSTLPDKPCVSTRINHYGMRKPKFVKPSSKATKAEARKFIDENHYVNFTSEEYPTTPRSGIPLKPRNCRPYSSVKYNRKVEME